MGILATLRARFSAPASAPDASPVAAHARALGLSVQSAAPQRFEGTIARRAVALWRYTDEIRINTAASMSVDASVTAAFASLANDHERLHDRTQWLLERCAGHGEDAPLAAAKTWITDHSGFLVLTGDGALVCHARYVHTVDDDRALLASLGAVCDALETAARAGYR